MKCYLMNKNTKVALIELNTEVNIIEKIYNVYNIDFAPLSFKTAYLNKNISDTKALNEWYRGRGIPDWRKDIKNLLNTLNIKSTDELLNKSYGLSLSDQYWIKRESEENLKWNDINFFTNDFKYKGYLKASLNSSENNKNIDLYSPNNTTDGMLQKAWIIENNKRILVKGTYCFTNQEPLNEWLTSLICKNLDIDYCDYKIDIIDGKLISKCENFINSNEEIITAYDVFFSERKDNNTSDLNHYINILEKNGIKDAPKTIQDMLLVDYIVMNFDRHLKNFGIIRNVETLKWEKITPIFDTGESMQCNKLFNEINFNDDRCKFFTNINKKMSELLNYIDLRDYNLENLLCVPKSFKEKLEEYQDFTEMSDDRINKLYIGLNKRINDLIHIENLAQEQEKPEDEEEM